MALPPSATGRGEGGNAVNIDKLTFFSSAGADPITNVLPKSADVGCNGLSGRPRVGPERLFSAWQRL